MQNNADMSYSVSTQEVPVITYNDMAFISERNSIVSVRVTVLSGIEMKLFFR